MSIQELTSRVFQARDIAHRAHWLASSYAKHIALNEFYDNVLDAVDELVECYQGQFGLIDTFEVHTVPVVDVVKYLSDESDWIEAHRDKIAQGSAAIASLVDVLVSVYLRTIYKLENLA